jgi:hypothetical protein
MVISRADEAKNPAFWDKAKNSTVSRTEKR